MPYIFNKLLKNRDTHHMLYIIATPIGNLEDISFRSVKTLKSVDYIICEDTRISMILLNHLQIKKPLISYHDFSKKKDIERILSLLSGGKDLALISDAGTPLISDPGYKLILEAYRLNINITSIPGPCSVITALTLSGLPSNKFLFIGFLYNESDLDPYISFPDTMIIFESPRKILKTLNIIKEKFGNRDIAVIKELTKKFETILRGKADSILEILLKSDHIRGEYIIIIGPITDDNMEYIKIEKQLRFLLTKMSLKDAVDFLSTYSDIAKNQIYKIAKAIKSC